MDREREGERFSPSVGLVLLQGESFKILPPMWLLVFTLMTPPLPSTFSFFFFLPHDFPEFGAPCTESYACMMLISSYSFMYANLKKKKKCCVD